MLMQGVPFILKNARLDKGLTLEEVSKKIKIPLRYISALEDGRHADYPVEPYCSLYVREYANFLNLDGSSILAIFRRDNTPRRQSGIKFFQNGFHLTPRLFFSLLSAAFIGLLVTYLFWEYLEFNRPPELSVSWPENPPVEVSYINLEGYTNAESVVKINGSLVLEKRS